MPFVAHPAVMAFHPVLGDRVRHQRYIDHLANTLRPTLRKRPPTVRTTVQGMLHNLGGNLPGTNVRIRPLLADFLLPRRAVCLHKRRNSAGNPRRRILAQPLKLCFQHGYPLKKLLIEQPLLFEKSDQFFSREGFEVWHTLLFA